MADDIITDSDEIIWFMWDNSHRLTTISEGKLIKVFKERDVCYHYTSLDSFWKIIESETFFATHVRFSNDSQERKYGKKIIEELLKDVDDKDDISHNENFFLMCFCEESDLLSQWREYGKVGVSIGMDFRRNPVYTILGNGEGCEDIIVYSHPMDVIYAGEEDKGSNGSKVAFSVSGNKFYGDDLKGCLDCEEYLAPVCMKNLIPYIKHAAFFEEKESRLLFLLTPPNKNLEKDYVFYRDTTSYKTPYIKVKCGNNLKNDANCEKIFVPDKQTDVLEIINKWVSEHNERNSQSTLEIERMSQYDEDESKQIHISQGKNQEGLFNELEEVFLKKNIDVKIWCDGYWPIRSIMVGPTINKEIICESIEHYCKTKYWLKHVDVSMTKTPYRERKD